jgi:hypothetical protein
VIQALRTHPVVIIGGLLHENPFFVPPDEFLHEIRERRSARVGVRRFDSGRGILARGPWRSRL